MKFLFIRRTVVNSCIAHDTQAKYSNPASMDNPWVANKRQKTPKSREFWFALSHVFAHMETAIHGKMVNVIGIARLGVEIGRKT